MTARRPPLARRGRSRPSRSSPSATTGASVPASVDELGQPVVEARGRCEHEVRLGDRSDVGRRGVEGVHLAALRARGCRRPRASPPTWRDQVGEDGRRGDHPDRVGAAGDGVGASRRRRPHAREGERERDEPAAAAAPHAPTRAPSMPEPPWQAAHRPKISSRWAVTRNPERRADLAEHLGQAVVVDVERAAAARCRSRGGGGRGRRRRRRGRRRAGRRARRGRAT